MSPRHRYRHGRHRDQQRQPLQHPRLGRRHVADQHRERRPLAVHIGDEQGAHERLLNSESKIINTLRVLFLYPIRFKGVLKHTLPCPHFRRVLKPLSLFKLRRLNHFNPCQLWIIIFHLTYIITWPFSSDGNHSLKPHFFTLEPTT